jgi:hypothetical protein
MIERKRRRIAYRKVMAELQARHPPPAGPAPIASVVNCAVPAPTRAPAPKPAAEEVLSE